MTDYLALSVSSTYTFYSQRVAVFAVQLQCCGITGYNDYNVDIWNTNPGIWQGRNPNVLAPLTCCVQNDDSNVYPPTINDLSQSCLYNGTVPSDYYQPVGRNVLLLYSLLLRLN